MINNLFGILAEQDRPIMYGYLRAIEKRLGSDIFPLIPQIYYPSFENIVFTFNLPFVVKIGWPHAGYGKIRCRESSDIIDVRSVVALTNNYSIAEPFIESDYEIRIVFIAPDYYRVHKRRCMGWKVNMGFTNTREDIEMTPLYKLWCYEVRKEFHDMDCFWIDGIISKTGKHYILEVNGSSQGFAPEHIPEYLSHYRELVRMRLHENLEKNRERSLPDVPDDLNKDTLITNLRNRIEELERELASSKGKKK